MRVVGGKARGTILRSPSSEETRPITDRAKEALFNILAPRIIGCRFLDMFAGTGGVGIEALSRGAERVTFIEISDIIINDLTWNIRRTRFERQADVRHGDAFDFIRTEDKLKYDIIFVAPPQWVGMCQRAMYELCQHLNLLSDNGIVITQHDPTEVVEVDNKILVEYDKRKYGGVQFNFYTRP